MELERSFLKDETPNQNQKTFLSFLKREGVGGGTRKIGRFLVLETSVSLFPETVVRNTMRAERTS
jgi:hypothetical protein